MNREVLYNAGNLSSQCSFVARFKLFEHVARLILDAVDIASCRRKLRFAHPVRDGSIRVDEVSEVTRIHHVRRPRRTDGTPH